MKRTIKIGLAMLMLCVAYVCLSISPIFFQKNSSTLPSNYNIIAHRGASYFAPENTLASIELAISLNPNSIEIDVQQTLDSVVVLMHDTTLDRTTNGTGLIKEKTFQEISKLDAGSWFSNDFYDEKIPTLEQVILLTKGKCPLIIEIKKGHNFYPNIEKNILKTIQKLDAEKWVAIHSFDYKILETVHALNPNIPLHKLFIGKFHSIPFAIATKLESLDLESHPYIETFSLNYRFANKEVIGFLKSKGKKVNVWTVNNPDTAKKLLSLGVDGIITDHPKLLE